MKDIISKGVIFLGLSLISFLPVVLVAYTSNFDLGLASEISISFAYVGVFFSIAYLGQRSYLAINATSTEGVAVHAIFRFINITFVIALLVLICIKIDLSLYVLCVVIAIKLSESVIDLSAGYATKTKTLRESSSEFLFYAALRAIFLGGIFFALPVVSVENFFIHVISALLLFSYFFMKLIPVKLFLDEVKKYNLVVYRLQFVRVFGFGLAAITCSILTASPRLLLVGGGGEVVAIALSAAPVSALLFQAIWLSNIKKLGSRAYKDYFIFLVEIFVVLLVVYFSSPIWEILISYIYGEGVSESKSLFVDVVLASVVFFAAMALVNIFKFEAPMFESAVYAFSAAVYMIAYLVFGCSVSTGLMYSAASMLASVFCLLIVIASFMYGEPK